jgi:hypothetical protein
MVLLSSVWDWTCLSQGAQAPDDLQGPFAIDGHNHQGPVRIVDGPVASILVDA